MRTRPTPFALACWCLVSSCGRGDDAPEPAAAAQPGASDRDAAASAEQPHADAPPAGVRADGSIVSAVEWFHGSLDQALAQAKRDGKLVFVDVGAYWCPPCHQLDEKTFVDAEVAAHLGRAYVAVHIDAETAEGPEIVDRYHVLAYPTLLVLEATGVEKGRLTDFIEPAALIEKLGRIEAGGNVLDELREAAQAAPRDLEAAYAYANALALAAKRDEAVSRLDAVVAADPGNAKGLAAKAAFDRTMFITYKIDRDYAGAVEAYRALQRDYPGSRQAVSAHRQLGRVLNDMGKPDEAVAELEAMIATDPANVDLKASYGWFSFREKCRPAQGLAAVQAGLEQAPDSAELHYLAAELQHMIGDDAAALASIQRASELEPKTAYYRRQVQRFSELAGKTG